LLALLLTPLRSVFKTLPVSKKSRPQGLATLSTVSAHKTLAASFSSQRSWASPFEAFLLSHGRSVVSYRPLRPCAFVTTLLGLLPTLRRLAPMKEAVSLVAPRRISPGRDLLLPWASGLWGAPSPEPGNQVSLSAPPLASLPTTTSYLTVLAGPQGLPSSAAWPSPSEEGAGPSDLSHRLP
jgi:hypothetical protein